MAGGRGEVSDSELPSTASAGALAALAAAARMLRQTDPAIWFDSWYNDSRDNDLDGKIDGATEKGGSNADGSHYGSVYSARVGPVAIASIDMVPASLLKTVNVTYKVCIDVPIESYRAAHVPISHNRWIPAFFTDLKHRAGWRVWTGGKRPPTLMDGDIVAANNPQHQHAGIVTTGMLFEAVLSIDCFARWIGT
jgi:hypothetical protein